MAIKMETSRKGGMFSKLIGIIILVLFLAVVFLTFFSGSNGKLNVASEKLKNIINGVPEIDPNEGELNFFRNNDAQLAFLTEFDKVIQTSMNANIAKDACLAQLPNFDAGFYIKDSNYNLYLDQSGDDIQIRLTQYRKQDTEPNSKKIDTPVQTTVVKGAKLCIIRDANARQFYKDFNYVKAIINPDTSKINPVRVDSIMISSGIEEDTPREIGFKTTAAIQNDYEMHTFFKKNDKTTIYILRLKESDGNYLCFFPAYSDTFTGCSAPDSEGFSDSDCFDTADRHTLSYNIGKGYIPADYICTDAVTP
jgi:hypothetical protein